MVVESILHGANYTGGEGGSLAGQQPGVLHAPLSTARAKYHQTGGPGGALDSKSLIVRMKKKCRIYILTCQIWKSVMEIHEIQCVKSTNPM